jgi:membrane protease YdiL (CAAX protease family)
MNRRALALLFGTIAAGLATVAVFAALAGGGALVVTFAAGGLAAWMADLARRTWPR